MVVAPNFSSVQLGDVLRALSSVTIVIYRQLSGDALRIVLTHAYFSKKVKNVAVRGGIYFKTFKEALPKGASINITLIEVSRFSNIYLFVNTI